MLIHVAELPIYAIHVKQNKNNLIKKTTNKKPGKINQQKKRPRFFLNPRNHVL